MEDRPRRPRSGTSWEGVSRWYDRSLGADGNYYHQQVVLPGALRLLELSGAARGSLLDLGCGQGVLARQLPPAVEYWGVDSSAALIEAARRRGGKARHFLVADATRELPVPKRDFTHAAAILSLQNMDGGGRAVANAARHLAPSGRLVIVLNHPCFRIPRQSSWEVDARNKLQYRRVNRYASPLRIPLQAHPSMGQGSPLTWSFHHPLTDYARWLKDAGFLIEGIEEWASDKVSVGKAARQENLSRREFPLFLAFSARKP